MQLFFNSFLHFKVLIQLRPLFVDKLFGRLCHKAGVVQLAVGAADLCKHLFKLALQPYTFLIGVYKVAHGHKHGCATHHLCGGVFAGGLGRGYKLYLRSASKTLYAVFIGGNYAL